MHLVKAEILWTRKCNLRCKYCGMYREDDTAVVKKDWNLWKKGIKNLHNLGCQFTAIYGAEPLLEMEYLPEYLQETLSYGMYHTLITNCTGKDVKRKLKTLIHSGLHSLTVSFDGDDGELQDEGSAIKSSNALDMLDWFQKENPSYRDVAVVFTLTKQNLFSILQWIPILSEKNIFVFFDLIHSDIGNPGTKCRNYSGIDLLLFSSEDAYLLSKFGTELLKMKKSGKYNIHQSENFINILIHTPELYIDSKWNCASSDVFPSWITIDNDGTAMICDDFYIKGEKDWKFWELTEDIFVNDFSPYWKEKTLKYCKGCFWNTHYDAHQIKEGNDTFSNYINNSFGVNNDIT